MKPHLRRIAELWYKANHIAPLTESETREWSESHQANRLNKQPARAYEVVMGYLWDRAIKHELCQVEMNLLIWALDKNLDQYWQWRKLENCSLIAQQAGDKKWQRQIERLKEVFL
ncbi:DUF7667 family protein [Lihuaxuella thermophila]|uniref:Uncharacterized protein n=1 Tax=Lihuaxuella thermophila TaxID=1173111 RepID=A0A1H8HA46_9BACL|nr:hypothetical protein [Lihuaxuella thermophila]SEN53201.1 hypothetical protein SAMN05444955_113116 [Lihuaxuella thermophila]